MLVFIECINCDKPMSVAINPTQVVAVVEVKSNEYVKYKCLILTSSAVEYRSTENYLDVVGKINSSL
jgi:hypothetical protein